MVIMARLATERRKTIILTFNKDNFDQPNELASAIFSNNVDKIKEFIIDKDILSTPIDQDGSSCLHLSSYFNRKEITGLFLKAGIKADSRDNEFYTPLHSACLNNASDCVKLLIEQGADLNSRTKNWLTPLHICATKNSFNCLVHLIKNEASLNIADNNQITALHYSTLNGFLNITLELLKAGANPRLKDLNGCNCLHYASLNNNLNVMKLLLAQELDINQKDNNYLTPLHYACLTTNYEMVQFLIDNGADINAKDKFGNTPLHYACAKYSKLSQSIIEDNEDRDICKLLITRNAKINIQNNLHLQPIHLAIRECALTIAYHKQNFNFDCRDYLGRTPLHIACFKGHHQLVDLLIKYGVDLRAKDKFNRTPLHYAVESNQIELIEKLIVKDPELINLVDDYNCDLLFYAASFNNVQVWDLLIKYHDNKNRKDNFGRCVQFYAAHSKQLLQTCLPITDNLDKYNRNLLFYTLTKASSDSYESLEYLLQNSKLDVNQRDIHGRTPLHYSIILNLDLHSELLLRYNTSLYIEDIKNLTPIHYIIIINNFEILNNLIDIGLIDLNESRYRVCLMQLAAYYGSNACLQILIQNNYKYTTNLTKSLEYAVWQKNVKCVDTILRLMVKLDKISDLYKCNALQISALNSDFECFDRLMTNLEKCDLCDEYGRTTMMFALVNCKKRNYCIDSLLKRENCDLNATDKECRNVLFYSVYYENLEMVELFLQLGVNSLQKCLSGKTVLHLAAIIGNSEIFNCLLQNFKKNNISYDTLLDSDGLDPFHYACYKGNSSIVRLLIETFPEKNTILNYSFKKINYLHLAAYSGDEECMKLILNHFGQSIVNKLDSKGRNALHYLCMSKIISLPYSSTNNIISQPHLTSQNNLSSIDYEINKKQLAAYKLLINNQININCKDKFSKTPLMIAIQNSADCRLSLCLIDELTIDLTAKDINKQTVLHYACKFKNELAGQKLIRKDSSLIESIDNNGTSALHIAASNGLLELTKSLLLNGASCSIEDSDGMTPALACAKSADVADCLDLLIEVMILEKSQKDETNISHCTTMSNHHQSGESIHCSSPILDYRKSLISQRSHRRSESNSSRRSELISSFEDDSAFKN